MKHIADAVEELRLERRAFGVGDVLVEIRNAWPSMRVPDQTVRLIEDYLNAHPFIEPVSPGRWRAGLKVASRRPEREAPFKPVRRSTSDTRQGM